MNRTARFLAASALPAMLLVTACGGGGGGGVNSIPPPPPAAPMPPPPPPPPPSPAPPPPPPPSGAINHNTQEFRNSAGIAHANAYVAYDQGITGQGITVGVIDSGIDTDNSEFAGRISPASRDFGGSRGIEDIGGHGTAVTGVIAAARDNDDIVGLAFGATILTLRTDEPGSCGAGDPDNDGCSHPTDNIARAIDYAIGQNARVINISLGGSAGGATLRNAIARAAAAGIVIVISAGNDSAADPDPLALSALDSGANGLAIIAGSVGAGDVISDFSNKAGRAQAVYIAALGERIRSFDNMEQDFLYSGTSFSAPQVTAAVALLAQAFPNLSGKQIVNLLYRSARDAGAAGDDRVYGQGILDLAAAFSPQGGMSLPGTALAVSGLSNVTLSAPMGDATQQDAGAIILDGFDRAFVLDLARTVQRMPRSNTLAAALDSGRTTGFAAAPAPGAMIAVSIRKAEAGARLAPLAIERGDAERARVIAGLVAAQIDPDTRIGFGFSRSGNSVGAQLNGRLRPAFLIAQNGSDEAGFAADPGTSVAIRRQFGATGLTLTAERGEAVSRRDADNPAARYTLDRAGYDRVSLSADRHIGPLRLDAGLDYLSETSSFLGARLGNALGGERGADSLFADLGASIEAGHGWSFAADARHGWTQTRGSNALFRGGSVRSYALSADVSKAGVLDRSDRLSLRFAQPLRVYRGGFDLSLPVSYDYATLAAGYENRAFNLAPTGREIDIETAYSRAMFGGWLTGNLFYRSEPGHFETAPDDIGAAMRFTLGF